MPIPLFTADEKPSNTETLAPYQRGAVTSTPLTSGLPHEPISERRRSSTSEHQAPAAVSGSGTASTSRREQTKEEREEAERLYEERMEDEYAKREGGA